MVSVEAAVCSFSLKQEFLKISQISLPVSLFNKVASLLAYNFIKKRFQHRGFPVQFAKFLRAPFSQNTSGGCFCYYKVWKSSATYLFLNDVPWGTIVTISSSL